LDVSGTEDRRRLHYEDLGNLYSSSERTRIIELRRMRSACHVARLGRYKKSVQVWSGNLKRDTSSRPRPRRRWEDNIKIGVKQIGWEGVDWIHLTWNRDQRQTLMN
jgi:hypothetical protein